MRFRSVILMRLRTSDIGLPGVALPLPFLMDNEDELAFEVLEPCRSPRFVSRRASEMS